ncbi:MAG: RNA polymerase sigma factor [Gaiellaceae bacterium]
MISLLRGRIALAANSTREARFIELYEEHFEAVRRYVWRREPAIADDVVAETFLVAWRRLDDVPASARPWLIGVARNVRLNVRRGVNRQQAVVERLAGTAPVTAAEHVSREADVVRGALATLSERDREVLLLTIWDELDRSAIAEVLGCTQGNVSLRLHRARRRFAAAVDKLNACASTRVSSSLISGGVDV